MIDSYELAVARDEAEDLADEIARALPTMAVPGASIGIGVTALIVLVRRLIDTLPQEEQQKTRDNVAALIRMERWSK